MPGDFELCQAGPALASALSASPRQTRPCQTCLRCAEAAAAAGERNPTLALGVGDAMRAMSRGSSREWTQPFLRVQRVDSCARRGLTTGVKCTMRGRNNNDNAPSSRQGAHSALAAATTRGADDVRAACVRELLNVTTAIPSTL